MSIQPEPRRKEGAGGETGEAAWQAVDSQPHERSLLRMGMTLLCGGADRCSTGDQEISLHLPWALIPSAVKRPV